MEGVQAFMKMSDRLQDLLNICVEEYVKSAIPVASLMLAGRLGNNLSSATIRNDLRILENMGFLQQVYTSGGRVPTTLGYKSYIDTSPTATFVGDIVNDLYALTLLAERIQHKLGGGGRGLNCDYDYGKNRKKILTKQGAENVMSARRQNIQRMLEIPNIEMSTYYLVIKEKLDSHGRK
jgi:hypothetical protein